MNICMLDICVYSTCRFTYKHIIMYKCMYTSVERILCACMYVCMYVCIYVRMYMYMYVCINVYI